MTLPLFAKLPKQYVILDTETTGLNPRNGDAILELAALKIDEGGTELGFFHSFINPRIPISIGASMVNGLTDEFIADNGKLPEHVFPSFVAFCANCTLVGHNLIKFDLPFINKHLEDLRLLSLRNPVLDTLELSRAKLKISNYKLGTIATHLSIPYIDAHRAENDVRITKEVFLKLVRM
ncbi:MAG: DNA polymerase III subunit alpha, Gram-positive type [Parcubacteria group bacterium Gr01-1014_18]|nr:MAG: DNA polymerase III subunit alpha, Gram-positive type [Parcubacteria group bacterium Greene0416_36]TSC80026.1 MAG: DNA polymerase III subunit alpha, Gram-positive type [Parcubacteria group bacterium Gr01-1014_18]TSC98106.1 MAG: DNA polymerase III subunit alpha, Gram-positive type [Parcubacteria group bacterium Greene1014_20]TSD06622.1 MAG: DNA polymerase III subunit alpha, Gram-positive type [Parcubacteria group bacterium Greene0714_2]